MARQDVPCGPHLRWSVLLLLACMGLASAGLAWRGYRSIGPSIDALIVLPQARMAWNGGNPGLVHGEGEARREVHLLDGAAYQAHRALRDGGLVAVFGAGLLAAWCVWRVLLMLLRRGSAPTASAPPPAGGSAAPPPCA